MFALTLILSKFIDSKMNKRLFLLLSLFLINCSSFNFFKNKINRSHTIFIDDVKVKIEINSLKSISSDPLENSNQKELISKTLFNYTKWYHDNLIGHLTKNGFKVTRDKKLATLIIKPEILDLGEIRKKVIIYSIVFGVVSGVGLAVVTGHSELGAGVFLFEVVEESLYPIILVKLLKELYLIATVNYIFIDKNGSVLNEEDFTSFSNAEFMKTIPEHLRKERENMVHASLDKNSKKIVEFMIENAK